MLRKKEKVVEYASIKVTLEQWKRLTALKLYLGQGCFHYDVIEGLLNGTLKEAEK